MQLILAAARDYYSTRKKIWLKILVATIPAIIVGLCLMFISFKSNATTGKVIVDLGGLFKDFINVQIGAIAILVSFSVAMITILVSADNPNIEKLKETLSTECKPRNGEALNLFQVLLSNITYNVLIEVLYLVFLIICIFLQLYVGNNIYKWLMSISMFFIVHILHILLESVGQMYLTFWKKIG